MVRLKKPDKTTSPDGAECFYGYIISKRQVSRFDVRWRGSEEQEESILRASADKLDPVVLPLYDRTAIAVRADPASAKSPLYVVWLPQTENYKAEFPLTFLGRFLVISGLGALILAAYFRRPVAVLSAAAERFGAGELGTRIDRSLIKRKDEVGRISRSFNEMAARIETLVERQRIFLANIAHELGSPLTRLNLALAICKRKLGPELAPEVARIESESLRLNALVDELLLHARLESGNELERDHSAFDVLTCLRVAIKDANFEADERQVTVQTENLTSFNMRGCPELLQRAFDNVLRNALRFGSLVKVRSFLDKTGQVGFIEIEDNGPGIPEGMEEQIFDPFVRVLTPETVTFGKGAGLGLAIAKQVVAANRGEISAHRAAQGGLLIRFRFPVEPVAADSTTSAATDA